MFVELTSENGQTIYINIDAIQHFEKWRPQGRPISLDDGNKGTMIFMRDDRFIVVRELPEDVANEIAQVWQ